jgi:hypothetical protein
MQTYKIVAHADLFFSFAYFLVSSRKSLIPLIFQTLSCNYVIYFYIFRFDIFMVFF